jgi:predicted aconitase
MAEKSCNVSQAVDFVAVNSAVVVGKSIFKRFCPNTVEFAESLANETVKVRIRSFLRTTLDDHVDHFNLEKEKSRSMRWVNEE